MMTQINFYSIVCRSCDWAINWFDTNDPWQAHVTCPYHPQHKAVLARNRATDSVSYLPGTIQYDELYKVAPEAYGSVRLILVDEERGIARTERNPYQPPALGGRATIRS